MTHFRLSFFCVCSVHVFLICICWLDIVIFRSSLPVDFFCLNSFQCICPLRNKKNGSVQHYWIIFFFSYFGPCFGTCIFDFFYFASSWIQHNEKLFDMSSICESISEELMAKTFRFCKKLKADSSPFTWWLNNEQMHWVHLLFFSSFMPKKEKKTKSKLM